MEGSGLPSVRRYFVVALAISQNLENTLKKLFLTDDARYFFSLRFGMSEVRFVGSYEHKLIACLLRRDERALRCAALFNPQK